MVHVRAQLRRGQRRLGRRRAIVVRPFASEDRASLRAYRAERRECFYETSLTKKARDQPSVRQSRACYIASPRNGQKRMLRQLARRVNSSFASLFTVELAKSGS